MAISFGAHDPDPPETFQHWSFKNRKQWVPVEEEDFCVVYHYFPATGVTESITAHPAALLMLQCRLILILHLVCRNKSHLL